VIDTILLKKSSVAICGIASQLFPRVLILAKVGLVEEVGKEQQVAQIDGEGKVQVGHGVLACFRLIFRPSRLYAQNGENDKAAQKHLHELQTGQRHGHKLGQGKIQRAQRVVRVHQSMNHVVHVDEPSKYLW